MNVSLDNKVIWFSPECTGGHIIRNIFKNFGFYRFDTEKGSKLTPLDNSVESSSNVLSEIYQNFSKIATVRNPYDRVWCCYCDFYTKTLDNRNFEHTKEKFDYFLRNAFIEKSDGIILDPLFSQNSYFSKWTFDDLQVDRVIRFEYMEQDLTNLEFLKNNLSSDKISYLRMELAKMKTPFDFKKLYTIQNARKIYEFYKKYFIDFDYDPFSFTTEEISERDKIKFIHGYDF